MTTDLPTGSASGEASSQAYSGLGKGAHGKVRNSRKASANSARGQKSRSRACRFRKKEESMLMLDMICKDGRRYSVEQPGHLNMTKHDTVLQLLERRASRLRKDSNQLVDKVHDWSIDETGTIDTSRLAIREIEQQEKLDIRGVSDEVLRVHGTMPGQMG